MKKLVTMLALVSMCSFAFASDSNADLKDSQGLCLSGCVQSCTPAKCCQTDCCPAYADGCCNNCWFALAGLGLVVGGIVAVVATNHSGTSAHSH